MPVNYICKRCNYTSKRLGDLKKHLNKKIICTKTPKSYGYTDEELIILSLIPYNNDNQQNNVINISTKDTIIIDKQELFDIITNIELNKKKECEYCSKKFNTINNLKNHVLTNCRLKLSLNKNELQNDIYKNSGFRLQKDDFIYSEIYEDWFWNNNLLQTKNKKWVNTYFNEEYKPSQKTEFTNLYLSGGHTKTSIRIWSMEAACESGKITANLIHLIK